MNRAALAARALLRRRQSGASWSGVSASIRAVRRARWSRWSGPRVASSANSSAALSSMSGRRASSVWISQSWSNRAASRSAMSSDRVRPIAMAAIAVPIPANRHVTAAAPSASGTPMAMAFRNARVRAGAVHGRVRAVALMAIRPGCGGWRASVRRSAAGR
ncbi:hypothetical protein OVY48_19435 [Sphingobium sp. SA2]|uniref:hypothetical protein n=1 Tax=Sphingobium sp. SA2 TaxID=1524832 RepID=UPI0028C24897|nr:hypothetical protein [Sphingobium sp. SA2]MDT7535580.1 hypothetical protein [Sphingobium sp. SA2]